MNSQEANELPLQEDNIYMINLKKQRQFTFQWMNQHGFRVAGHFHRYWIIEKETIDIKYFNI